MKLKQTPFRNIPLKNVKSNQKHKGWMVRFVIPLLFIITGNIVIFPLLIVVFTPFTELIRAASRSWDIKSSGSIVDIKYDYAIGEVHTHRIEYNYLSNNNVLSDFSYIHGPCDFSIGQTVPVEFYKGNSSISRIYGASRIDKPLYEAWAFILIVTYIEFSICVFCFNRANRDYYIAQGEELTNYKNGLLNRIDKINTYTFIVAVIIGYFLIAAYCCYRELF